MNKKGQIVFEDMLYALAFIFFAGIFIFILYYAFNQVKPELGNILDSNLPVGETGINSTRMLDKVGGTVQMFDYLFPMIIIGLIIMLMVSASMMNSHPVFFVVSIVILGVAILLGVIFSNTYQQITEDANFGATSADFPITNVFMKYLPVVISIIIIATFIILFTKSGGSQSGL